MEKHPVSQDLDFAKLIDDMCTSCQSIPDDTFQLVQIENLDDRGFNHPKENPVTERLKARCHSCLAAKKPDADTLREKYSCIYRGGPITPEAEALLTT